MKPRCSTSQEVSSPSTINYFFTAPGRSLDKGVPFRPVQWCATFEGQESRWGGAGETASQDSTPNLLPQNLLVRPEYSDSNTPPSPPPTQTKAREHLRWRACAPGCTPASSCKTYLDFELFAQASTRRRRAGTGGGGGRWQAQADGHGDVILDSEEFPPPR